MTITATKAFTLGAVEIGATVINEITDSAYAPGIADLMLSGDGAVYNSFMANEQIKPVLTFSTRALKALIDAATILGKKLSTATGGVTFAMYGQQYADGGTREGASKHNKILVSKGILVIDSIRADQRGAVAQCSVYAVTADGNSPINWTKNVSLPTTGVDSQEYVSWKEKLNGTEVGSEQSLNFAFGVKVETVASQGNVYPDMAYMNEIQPVVTCETLDLDKAQAMPETLAQADTGSETKFYLKQVDKGGSRKSGTGTNNICFTMRSGKHNNGGVRMSHRGRAVFTIISLAGFDGVNAPLTVDTAFAG